MAGFSSAVLECAKRKSEELESLAAGTSTTTMTTGDDETGAKKRSVGDEVADGSNANADDYSSSISTPAVKKARLAFMHAFAALPLPELSADDAIAAVRSLLASNRLEMPVE